MSTGVVVVAWWHGGIVVWLWWHVVSTGVVVVAWCHSGVCVMLVMLVVLGIRGGGDCKAKAQHGFRLEPNAVP